jgi:hypothetical protein
MRGTSLDLRKYFTYDDEATGDGVALLCPVYLLVARRVPLLLRNISLTQIIANRVIDARRRAQRYDRQCQDQDPRQGGNPSRSTAFDFRRKAARGRPNLVRLQHPEGIDFASRIATSWGCLRSHPCLVGQEIQLREVHLP